jgi:hypothetical protein
MHDGRTGGVLMLVIALAAIATWVLPAGTFATLAYDSDRQHFVYASTQTGRRAAQYRRNRSRPALEMWAPAQRRLLLTSSVSGPLPSSRRTSVLPYPPELDPSGGPRGAVVRDLRLAIPAGPTYSRTTRLTLPHNG